MNKQQDAWREWFTRLEPTFSEGKQMPTEIINATANLVLAERRAIIDREIGGAMTNSSVGTERHEFYPHKFIPESYPDTCFYRNSIKELPCSQPRDAEVHQPKRYSAMTKQSESEAPERIYVTPEEATWRTSKLQNRDIEYVRATPPTDDVQTGDYGAAYAVASRLEVEIFKLAGEPKDPNWPRVEICKLLSNALMAERQAERERAARIAEITPSAPDDPIRIQDYIAAAIRKGEGNG